MLCVQVQSQRILKFIMNLLDKGRLSLDVDQKNNEGDTALLIAVKSGNLNGAMVLHERGKANAHICDRNGRSVSDLVKESNLEMKRFIDSKSHNVPECMMMKCGMIRNHCRRLQVKRGASRGRKKAEYS